MMSQTLKAGTSLKFGITLNSSCLKTTQALLLSMYNIIYLLNHNNHIMYKYKTRNIVK